jgi:hypothetical protein
MEGIVRYKFITDCAAVNKEMYVDILRRLRDAARKKRHQKMENQDLVSPSRQCSRTPVGFDQGFLNKEQCNNTGATPILSLPG